MALRGHFAYGGSRPGRSRCRLARPWARPGRRDLRGTHPGRGVRPRRPHATRPAPFAHRRCRRRASGDRRRVPRQRGVRPWWVRRRQDLRRRKENCGRRGNCRLRHLHLGLDRRAQRRAGQPRGGHQQTRLDAGQLRPRDRRRRALQDSVHLRRLGVGVALGSRAGCSAGDRQAGWPPRSRVSA
ncbi:Uncharacterised protein [Mycobacteroides abscessus subsp. abscessus]|nr:Uncharacterised protein [Mycobacteroides abscessus subsp. abscessus]